MFGERSASVLSKRNYWRHRWETSSTQSGGQRTAYRTRSLELSVSWEAASCSVGQKCSAMLQNHSVHYLVHKSPPLLLITSYINSVHNNILDFSKIHFNIILSPRSRHLYRSVSFCFSYQNPCMHSSLPPRVHLVHPCPGYCVMLWQPGRVTVTQLTPRVLAHRITNNPCAPSNPVTQ
jgi:hypothetical protein